MQIVVEQFEVLSRNLPGRTEKNYKAFNKGQPTFRSETGMLTTIATFDTRRWSRSV